MKGLSETLSCVRVCMGCDLVSHILHAVVLGIDAAAANGHSNGHVIDCEMMGCVTNRL